MLKMHGVKKVYFCQFDFTHDEEWGDCCTVAVTVDKAYARGMDSEFRLATIDKVNECIEDLCVNGEYIKIIKTKCGVYGWVEYSWIDEFGWDEMFCGYVKIG